MLIKTKGIVLRKLPYSETSVIADLYTEDEGRISCIISGVRKPRARVGASLLELMSIVEVVVYFTDRAKLNRIREIRPAFVYHSIPFDVRKGAILLFMAELCAKTVREEEPNPSLYACIEHHLVALDGAEKDFVNSHLLFMIALADELGFGPSPDHSTETPYFDLMAGRFTAQIPSHIHYLTDAGKLAEVIRAARGSGEPLHLSRKERNQLLDDMVVYYRLHIESLREIRSHTVLRDVL